MRLAKYPTSPLLVLLIVLVTATDGFVMRLPRPPSKMATVATGIPDTSVRNQRAALGPLGMFGNMFGDTDQDKTTKELASFNNKLGSGSKFNTLVEYIRLWSHRFEEGGPAAKRMTTPVKVVIHDDMPDDGVDSCVSVRLLFQKVENTGYKDKDEDEEDEETKAAEKDDDQVKQGGVELLVEKLPNDTLRVSARRCNMDGETMVKEMSEETIVKELEEALEVWRQEQAAA